MESTLDCIACMLEQSLRAARAAAATEEVQERVLRAVMRDLAQADWSGTPIDIAMPMHRSVRSLLGVDDPFVAHKRTATEQALAALPRLRRALDLSGDPLHLALRISAAGNIIDLGALERYDLDAALERALGVPFAIDDYATLRQELDSAQSLLLFADNAGEIVFDRLLLETVLGIRKMDVSVCVKSGPFINDATWQDALAAGLDQIGELSVLEVSNGDGAAAPAYGSAEVKRWIDQHDVVIAKGQANYEALSDQPATYFVLMAKCPRVGESLQVDTGDLILKRNAPATHAQAQDAVRG